MHRYSFKGDQSPQFCFWKLESLWHDLHISVAFVFLPQGRTRRHSVFTDFAYPSVRFIASDMSTSSPPPSSAYSQMMTSPSNSVTWDDG